MTQFFSWIESTALAQWMGSSTWAFPVFEAVHVLAVAIVFGSIAIVDLRLLGWAWMRRPFSDVAGELLRWTWVGFGLAVVTGLLMFLQRASDYAGNFHFQMKMLFLVLAGVNMLIFELLTVRTVKIWDRELSIPAAARIAGLLSLAFWIAVIFFGRWIGFSIQGFNTPGGDFDFGDLDPAIFGL